MRTKIICSSFLLIILVACNQQKEIEIKNNKNVVIERYHILKKNPELKVGHYTKFYDDGKLLEIGNYNKEGKMEGERKLYFTNGKLMQIENYKNNLYDGKFVAYFEDGALQQEGFYKDNMMNGIWKNYYKEPRNVLKEEFTIKNNKINGEAKEYYTNGKLYAKGNKIELSEGFDVYDGEVQVYDSLGVKLKTLIYENGRQIEKKNKTEIGR